MTSRTNTLSDGNFPWSKVDDSLMDAVGKRDAFKVRSLVSKKKADPTKISPDLGVAAFHQAASFDKSDILNELLMFPSIDVNKTDARKRTALHHAVREGREECLNRLILMNANTMLAENEGLSALHLASMLGHMGCIRLLVSTVQSVDAKDDKGRTALFYAASRGSASSCRLLVEYGANIDATDNYGRTVLMISIQNGHQAACQYLLSRGANVSIRDNKDRDIRWYATNYNHADLLLFLQNGIDRRRSLSDTSNDEDERLAPSSQRKLAKKWVPELDLSRANPERKPGYRIHPSTTDSDQRSNSILEDEVNVKSANFVEHQVERNAMDERKEKEWTRERLELIRKLTDLADENKELLQWRRKSEVTEQQNLNLLMNQKHIYPLMEEVYESVESCRKQSSATKDETNISNLEEASRKLTLILQSLYEANRENALPTDEIGNPFASELERRNQAIRNFESSVKQYDVEIERLEEVIRKLKELNEDQQIFIQKQDEEIVQLKRKIQEQIVSLKKFGSVKELLCQITELDDVSDEQAADVIRHIAVEYQKLKTKYKDLKMRQREANTTTSESHQKSAAAHDVLKTESNKNSNDWRSKTLEDLRVMKDLSATPISDLLQEQLIVLRQSLESQIATVRNDAKSGSLLPLQTLEGYKNSENDTDGRISRDRETDVAKKEVLSRSGRDLSEPQLSRTSEDIYLEDDERIRYETEIRQLRRRIEQLKMEDSGVRTMSTDAEDDSRTLLMLSQEMRSPVPDESFGILSENRRLRTELEKLRSRIKPENGVAVCASDVEVRTDSKGMQTDDELQKEVMISRMVSSYEQELLDKVKSLKSQNDQLRSEIEALSVQSKSDPDKHLVQSATLGIRSEHVGSSAHSLERRKSWENREIRESRNSMLTQKSGNSMERRESGKRWSHGKSDSSGESNESNLRDSNSCVADNEKKRKKRKSENVYKKSGGTQDINRRWSLSSLSQTSCSSDEENNGRTRQEQDGKHLTKKTSGVMLENTRNKNSKAGEQGKNAETKSKNVDDVDRKTKSSDSKGENKDRHAETEDRKAKSKDNEDREPYNENRRTEDVDRKTDSSSSDEEEFINANESHNTSSNLHNVNLPGRTSDGSLKDPALLTADFAQKVLVKKLMKVPDPNTAPLNYPHRSPATHVKATTDLPLADAKGAVVARRNAPVAAKVKSNHGRKISHNGVMRSDESSDSGSSDDEAFESMFQVNQDLIDPSKTVTVEQTGHLWRRPKIKLLRFDEHSRSKLRTDLETVMQENTRLREEMSSLIAELNSLRQQTSGTAERVDTFPSPALTSVEKVKRQIVESKGVSVGQTVASKEIKVEQSVASVTKGQPVASVTKGQPVALVSTRQPSVLKETSPMKPVTFSDEETKSEDEGGYRFLSEDEHGTFKFKEFSEHTSPSQLDQEEKKDTEEEENSVISSDARTSYDDDISQPSLTSGSTSLNSTDEAEKDTRSERRPNGRRRKQEERHGNRLKSKVSNEIQQHRLNETVTLVARNQTEPFKNKNRPPNHHRHQYNHQPQQQQQQQHSSRKATQLHVSKGNKLTTTTLNSVKEQKEIPTISGATLTDADKTQIIVLQKQLQDSETIYKAIIGTYRSHLLASIQGCLDSEVADALCRIVTLQNGRSLEY